MTALVFFEEIRFAVELLIAECLFASAVGKKKDNHIKRLVGSGTLFVLASCIYPFLIENAVRMFSNRWVGAVSVAWYVLLALISVLITRFCYQLTISDTLFLCVTGYCVQHMEFVAVNEVLAKGIWTRLPDMLPLYIVVCAVTTFLIYALVYHLFRRYLARQKGKLFDDRPENIAFTLMMYLLVFLATFMCQTIFTSGRLDYSQINYLGAAADFLICILILWVQSAMYRIYDLNREKDIVEHLLYERKRQYELSRENIEIINQKCHDLKHQIRALKQVDAGERGQYIDELEKSIDIYDAVTETGNEVVDTILSEKSLNCEQRRIRLSCMVDAAHLDFMSTLDIYALLGNALDNAIESVSQYKEQEKRVISLTIKTQGDFLSIQTNNYCEKPPEIRGGLPVTTRRNRQYHGFGMKSMHHLAHKYGGSLAVNVENHVFTLQILLPMPREFLRLYDLKQQKPDVP